MKIELDLNLDEVNLILEALGNLPYARVYGLVQKIQSQARGQVSQQTTNSPELSITERQAL